MKVIIPFLVLLIVFGCTTNQSSRTSIPNLLRIDSLITQKNERQAKDFLKAYAINKDLVSPYYQKSQGIFGLAQEFESVIKDKEMLRRNKIQIDDYLISFNPYIDTLCSDQEFSNKMKDRYINYWIKREISTPPKDEDALSMIIDFKLLQFEITEYLFNQIGSRDYSFNLLKPLIKENSNTVKVGNTYMALIGIEAFDTTRYPIIKVGDVSLEIQDGYGVYRYSSKIRGKKTIEGKIFFQRNNYELDSIPFEHSFIIE